MPAEQGSHIDIVKPDDMHLHLRDLPEMADVLPHTVRSFARAIVMPNLRPPITTVSDAISYRERIVKALPESRRNQFEPLMTIYLTDRTTPDDIKAAKEAGIFAAKLYPAGATTNSEFGITSIQAFFNVFETMEKAGLPLLIHGEVTDPDVDIFDREATFIERYLHSIVKRFPILKIVLEHISTREAVSFVLSAPENVGATITPHHLLISRNDLLTGGIRPHNYCLPIVKREEDRLSLVQAAISGNPRFFAGTDSAPHAKTKKESACGHAGIYSAASAVEFYTEVFDREEALDRLEGFLSLNGARFYGLPVNTSKIQLIKESRSIPETVRFGDETLVPMRAGGEVSWTLQ